MFFTKLSRIFTIFNNVFIVKTEKYVQLVFSVLTKELFFYIIYSIIHLFYKEE